MVHIDFAFFVTPTESRKGLRQMGEVPREMLVSRPVLALYNMKSKDAKTVLLSSKTAENKNSAERIISRNWRQEMRRHLEFTSSAIQRARLQRCAISS